VSDVSPRTKQASGDLAPIREQVYKDTRERAYFDRYHKRARRRGPDGVYEVIRVLVSLLSWTVFRARAIGVDNVPASGPLILAPNHFSNLDHFFVGMFIRRKLRFMAKSQLFRWPMQVIYEHGGVFPVRRGARDEDAFITANEILKNGGCIAMYCEGGRSRTGKLGERARPGIGRLALMSGATVVPVAVHGSSHVRNWRRLRFPRVTVQYGQPLRFERLEAPTRHQQRAAADAIFDEIKALYGRLEREGRAAALARDRAERRERGARRARTA
jgi:1-acyl-sn-glycerol-3-phosphate acyltransferase